MRPAQATGDPHRAGLQDERRRMVHVRKLLTAALEQGAMEWPMLSAFIQASAHYLHVAVSRLVAQDLSLVHQLRPRLPAAREEDHAFIGDLEARLLKRKTELRHFMAAAETLMTSGHAGLPVFRAAAEAFFGTPAASGTAGGRPRHSLPPLIDAFCGVDAWTLAQKEADDCGSEQDAYKRVEAAMPQGLAAVP